ncbi:CRISPR-associated helicase/endonuclease Cas3 [Geobacter sp. SVR]|nr:CRISPR-associated helicase/endonuclease Cas3 [Geobacter sp. SVR]GCF86343.1 CRISPR-associated helicase/endonuclease Cas3 [Geobacter sp. SVR]
MASEFAATFEAGDWGRVAALLHDAGKATMDFIKRLEGSHIRVDHSTFGARLAQERAGRLGLLLSYVIAGHHGGLPDGGSQEGELHHRLKHGKIPPDVMLLPEAEIKQDLALPFTLDRDLGGFSLSFFTRMVYSCLVDADFLDTEGFVSPIKKSERLTTNPEQMSGLKASLDTHLAALLEQAEPTKVNRVRQAILTQCRAKAGLPPQIFSLTVPTGGGKTLSSLAFALDHAVANKLRRVIYAIPFTSIIEQNARVFQEILGNDQVLEHHCNYKESNDPEEAAYNRRRGLAAENWDAPLVVTTNVQFFESLFSNKPSRCRKLHNIAGSVIVLDEAQAIPTEYLEPCLAALRELVAHYNCSVVLCTATQPALDNAKLRTALHDIHEIIINPQQFYDDLIRTQVHFTGKLTDSALGAKIDAEPHVLCIVPTKPQARALFEQLSQRDGTYHLSTNMYPEHRRRALSEIRARLKAGMCCRVIATSLVEAGVDLDFPVVYRAMAGLDSIAQAAGRCNREGKMNDQGKLGQVYVYEPEKSPRMPWLKRCMSRAAETLRALPDADPLGLEAMRRYFELLYDVQELDKKQLVSRLNQLTKDLYFPFREVAGEFRFIEDETIGVIVPVEPAAKKLVEELRHTEYPRTTQRKLQQYSVALRSREFAALEGAGALEMVRGEFPVLRNVAAYREDVGICIEGGDIWQAEDLIC